MLPQELFYPALKGLIRKWGLIHDNDRLEFVMPLAIGDDGEFIEYGLPYSTLRTVEDIAEADRRLESYSKPGLTW